jgi:hypothetical protein
MKQQPVVPEFFQLTYNRYLKLKTDEEKDKFWEEIMSDNHVSQENLAKHLKEGLLLLSDQVDALSQKAKAQMSV